jgi:ABC-type glycerol-3-phosphate transport system substrate-binding protein
MVMTIGPRVGQPGAARTRRTILLGFGAGTTALLAACTGPRTGAPAKQLKTGITLLWGGTGSSASRVALLQQQAALFQRQFPGINVEVVPGGDSLDKIKAGLAAGTPMDLVSITTLWPAFAKQGALVALDSYIARDKYDLKDFFPVPLESWRWRDKRWALPALSIQTPFVNLKVTEESGARQPPNTWSDSTWTWDAFLEYCRKVSRQDGGQTVQWGFTGAQGNFRLFMTWVWGNGGDMFDKGFTRVALSDQPALDGLQFQADLINKYKFMPHPDQVKAIGNPFQDNRAGINVTGVAGISALRRVAGLRWTVTALPRGAKGAFIGGGGDGHMLLSGGRSDEAWELLKVIESPEGDRLLAAAAEGLPARRSVAHDPEYLNPKEAPGADMKVIVESIETAFHPDPVLTQSDVIIPIVQDELSQSWSGQRSVSQSVEAIKARVEPLLKNEQA